MNENYYYLPLEQIKNDHNLESIHNKNANDIIGYWPYESYRQNVIKRADGYDLDLIVQYCEETHTITEILTGREIPILDIKILETPENNDEVKFKVFFNEVNFMNTHTYIRNVIHVKNKKEESVTFSDKNKLLMIDVKKLKHILELYKHRYTKEYLENYLNTLFAQGEEKLHQARLRIEEQDQQLEDEKEEVRRLLNDLKNQS